MSKETTQRSNCCNYRVKVVGRATLHYECCKCHQDCDIHYVQRKTWVINPKTRIVPDKREEENNKRIKKEINEN